MKILLQRVRTELYLSRHGEWLADSEAAFDFQHPKWLREYVAKHQLQNVQMVVKFDHPELLEVVPLYSPAVRHWHQTGA